MKLSIIVPIYNVKDYMRVCIESILKQDLSDCEVILVDDGSTDNASGQICDEYKEKYPDLIQVIHKTNGGLGDARNKGLEIAQGDYFFFVDSDDWIADGCVAKLKAAIDKYQADIIGFGFISVKNDVESAPELYDVPKNEVLTLEECPSMLLLPANAWSRIWKRELFLESGIRYPSQVWYEDMRTSLKFFALAKSIVYLDEAFYYYLQREGSIMNNKNLARNQEIMWATDDVIAWFKEQGLFEKYEPELCGLVVSNVLLFASVRVVKADPAHELLKAFKDYTAKNFPKYRDNKYIKSLGLKHKLALSLIEKGHYKLLQTLFAVKNKM